MKVIYATDLHGHKKKFNLLLNLTFNNDYDLCIIGADILPKHKNRYVRIEDQKSFMLRFLPEFFSRIQIPLIIDFGNDDAKCLYPSFQAMVEAFDHVHISHRRKFLLNDMIFYGMHFVPDYPFPLKDWCRFENEYDSPDMQGSEIACVSNSMELFNDLPDLNKYFRLNPTLEDYLSSYEFQSESFIFLSHAPPKTLGLDITGMNFIQVGSQAITNFIIDKQPIISLHGHVHESPWKSDITINTLNKTTCIQPGQRGAFQTLVYCEFDTDNVTETYKWKELEWKNR